MQDKPHSQSIQDQFADSDLLIDDLAPVVQFPMTQEALALHYAKQGLPVFPWRFKDSQKVPHITGWQERASKDPDQIRKWWRDWPKARAGMPTGHRSGISVLDLDVKKGRQGIENCRAAGVDPDTATPFYQTTLTGGRHLLFKHRDGLRNSADDETGIDVRGDGGWIAIYEPLTIDRAALPEWPAAFTPEAPDPYSVDDLLADPPKPVDWVQVQDALAHTPADLPRHEWIKIGMGLHHDSGGDAFEIWADWSKTCKDETRRASDRELKQQWASFAKGRAACPVTVASLFQIAKAHGWAPSHRSWSEDDFDDADDDLLIDDVPAPAKPAAKKKHVLFPADPMPSARALVKDHYANDKFLTLRHYRGSFWQWNGACYRELDTGALQKAIWLFLEQALKQGKENLIPFAPTITAVENVFAATKAVTNLPAATPMPSWLKGGEGLPAAELMPVANGLLHLPSGRLLNPTPAFFGCTASGVAFDPEAPQPAEWLRFLNQVWPDDPEAIATLQEIFGLLLSADTRYQKIPLLKGPKRSGKGTIARVLTSLLGQDNVAGPTLGSLATNFGLAPLIGKSVAIIADARLSGKADQAAIAERLLSISGEDSLTIDRKFQDAWTGRLGVRLLIMTNELPRLADASGALASRFLVLSMKQSFIGREDLGLGDRLTGELPGILNWAREGYLRLQARGYFVPPTSAREAVEELEELGSPVAAFVKECCTIGAGQRSTCADVFDAWRVWCSKTGRQHPGTVQSFGRDLGSVVHGLKRTRPRDDGDRVRCYEGLSINAAPDPFDD